MASLRASVAGEVERMEVEVGVVRWRGMLMSMTEKWRARAQSM